MDFNGRDNKELVLELLNAFNSFKQKLEDPNYIQMENSIRQMMEGQKEMREDISELKEAFSNAGIEDDKNSINENNLLDVNALKRITGLNPPSSAAKLRALNRN